ncbi:MAG: site-2 protease family protein [Acidobacteria bacterium]|nr:site-2 protease family protein [Acidobacteriota bacterium]
MPSPVSSGQQIAVPPFPLERRARQPIVRHLILFVLTFLTTTLVGAEHFGSYYLDFGTREMNLSVVEVLLNGLWYSASILAILGAHEFGHYYACRYYGVDASLPYFLPAPLPLTGTLGAFIRIRQTIPGKRELFDIGIAGPIAGFLVAIPVLLVGMSLSRVTPLPADTRAFIELGEPLLFKGAAWLFWGTPPEGYSINMHPMAFAAWFGLLATALNLFPIGQLDGGHISYAVLGRKSTAVTLGTLACLVGLTFVSSSWVVWTVLTLVMLLTFGPRHPRTADEDVPLDRTRLWLAFAALVMFVVCFTPAPIEPFDIVNQPDSLQAQGAP